MDTKHTLHVLVVRDGICGPVAAFWLSKAGAKVTIIERNPSLHKNGQSIDVEGPAKDIVRRMGLLEKCREKSTKEEGFALVDDRGEKIASIAGLVTQEIEILRPDLWEILTTAAVEQPNVKLRHGIQIVALAQRPDHVSVTFNNGEAADLDAVLAADGFRSKTRDLAFDQSVAARAIHHRDHYVSYFALPAEGDYPHSRFQHATRGRRP